MRLVKCCTICLLCTSMVLSMIGCSGGISKEAYEKVVAERDALAAQLEEHGISPEVTTSSEEENLVPSLNNPRIYSLNETASDGIFNIKLTDWKELDRVDDSFEYYVPDSGYKYLIAFIEVENITNENQTFYPILDFILCADSYELDNVVFGFSPPKIDGVSYYDDTLEILPGKKVRKYFSVIVPEKWSEMELIFQKKITIAFTKNGT